MDQPVVAVAYDRAAYDAADEEERALPELSAHNLAEINRKLDIRFIVLGAAERRTHIQRVCAEIQHVDAQRQPGQTLEHSNPPLAVNQDLISDIFVKLYCLRGDLREHVDCRGSSFIRETATHFFKLFKPDHFNYNALPPAEKVLKEKTADEALYRWICSIWDCGTRMQAFRASNYRKRVRDLQAENAAAQANNVVLQQQLNQANANYQQIAVQLVAVQNAQAAQAAAAQGGGRNNRRAAAAAAPAVGAAAGAGDGAAAVAAAVAQIHQNAGAHDDAVVRELLEEDVNEADAAQAANAAARGGGRLRNGAARGGGRLGNGAARGGGRGGNAAVRGGAGGAN